MADDLFARLQVIDKSVLTDVVRRDQHNASFEITDWSVRPLSDKGIINPDGLWLFSGEGDTGTSKQSWSVVVKVFKSPEQEPPPNDMWYWKRELLFAQSELLERLPGPVKAPRFYRIDEKPEGTWLWIEYIKEQRSQKWGFDDFAFVAHELGQWNGACIRQVPLPDETWLARRHYISWLSWMNVEQDWQFEFNQIHVPSSLRDRYEQLWAEREVFYSVLERLPQVISHFDSQRRNLFIHKNADKQDEIVAIDWAYFGIGALGAELNGLVADNGYMLEWPSAELTDLEEIVYPSYLQGLQDGGWSGNMDLVRLGYEAWKAVYFGLIFPGYTAWWCAHENQVRATKIFSLAEEELFWQVFPLLEFSLDGADTARRLINKTGIL